MKPFKKSCLSVLGCSTALAMVFSATGAQADVTAADVWADWQGYFASSGYGVSGQEAASGGELTVSDITMTVPIPEEEASVEINMGQITFAENGDGSVSVSMPASQPLVIMVDAPGDEDVTINADYLNTGMVMTVTGNPGDMTYQYTADEVAISVQDMVVEGQSMSLGTIMFSLADVAGTTIAKVGNLRTADQNITASSMSYDLDIVDPEGSGETVKLASTFKDLKLEGTNAMPLEMDPMNFAAAMADGFNVDMTMGYTGGATEFNFTEDGSAVQGTSSSEAGAFTVAMGAEGLTYDIAAQGMQLAMAGGDIPLPIELAFGQAGFNLTMPVAKSDEEQDYALGLTLGEFTMSDLIWSLFDPAQQLPRDPATIDIDLTGKAKLFFDLMDPSQMEAVEAGEMGMPGELNSLALNALTVSLAGAKLTGEGAFTFDNEDLQTFDGVPAPDGSVDLKLTGGNGLLDKLIALGFVPEEQAMGVRMMMGLFAVPGEGEDELTSTIEVKSSGEVSANGQRLR